MVRIKVRWRCVNNSVCSCHSCLPAYANIGWCGLVATWRIYVYYTYVSYLVGKNQLLQGTSSVGDGYVFFRVPARSLEAKPLSLSFPCSLSLCLSVSVSLSLSLSLSVSFCLCLSPPHLLLCLSLPCIEEGTENQRETVRNCTWRPRLAHLLTIRFLGPFPLLLFPGIEEVTVEADPKWQIAG